MYRNRILQTFLLTGIVLTVFLYCAPHAFASFNFVRKWGTYGTGDGQFLAPAYMARDSSGNIYVADFAGAKVDKFDSSGNFITSWGGLGTGNGEFSLAAGIAIDSANNVYVADGLNGRVEKFDSSGTYLTTIGSPGSGDGQFTGPLGIAIDKHDNLYVVDNNNNRVEKFDSSGTFVTKWGTSGTGDGQFDHPYAIAVDSDSNVYVTDTFNARIEKFDSNGTFLAQWGSEGSGDGEFAVTVDSGPEGIAIDSRGNVYVSDPNNARVEKFTKTGTFLEAWGTSGTGDGQFKGAIGLVVDNMGNIYVSDIQNYRIQEFYDTNHIPAVMTSSSSGSSSGSSSAPSCSDTAPTNAPDLFQIDTNSTQAKLYFAPVADNANKYFISFGYTPGDMSFGTEISGNSTGVMSSTLNYLSPNSTYYVRVRAGNGCATGGWSNEMKVTTAKKGSTSGHRYFENFTMQIISFIDHIVSF